MSNETVSDPNALQEAEKYDNPVASREFILGILAEHAGPMTLSRLISHLEYDGDDERIEGLSRRLRAMERDGQVIRNRRGGYVPVTHTELVRGRVLGHRDGFGSKPAAARPYEPRGQARDSRMGDRDGRSHAPQGRGGKRTHEY